MTVYAQLFASLSLFLFEHFMPLFLFCILIFFNFSLSLSFFFPFFKRHQYTKT